MLKKNLPPGNSILNSAISLYCSLSGRYWSEQEIAEEFQVGPVTLSRWRKGKVRLEQIALLAKILHKIPRELRPLPFENTFQEPAPEAPPISRPLTELTQTVLGTKDLQSGILVVGANASAVASHFALQLLLDPHNNYNDNLLLPLEPSVLFSKANEIPHLQGKLSLLPSDGEKETIPKLPSKIRTTVGQSSGARNITALFLEKTTKEKSFELDLGYKQLLLAPLTALADSWGEKKQSQQLALAKRLTPILYTFSLSSTRPSLRRALLRRTRNLVYLKTAVDSDQSILEQIGEEYKIHDRTFPLNSLQENHQSQTEEGFLCQTVTQPQITRRIFEKI